MITDKMSIKSTKHVLITGRPGIGKTTLIKKVCATLKTSDTNVYGFYTEELRNEFNQRSGFDVVTLDGKRERLSRIMECLKPGDQKRFKVGQYYVFPNSFEQLVIPLFNQSNDGILVLDEIGKMELFSNKFQTKVKEAFESGNAPILATVPVLKGTRIPLVESIIANPKCQLISVDQNNRDNFVNEIVSYLMS